MLNCRWTSLREQARHGHAARSPARADGLPGDPVSVFPLDRGDAVQPLPIGEDQPAAAPVVPEHRELRAVAHGPALPLLSRPAPLFPRLSPELAPELPLTVEVLLLDVLLELVDVFVVVVVVELPELAPEFAPTVDVPEPAPLLLPTVDVDVPEPAPLLPLVVVVVVVGVELPEFGPELGPVVVVVVLTLLSTGPIVVLLVVRVMTAPEPFSASNPRTATYPTATAGSVAETMPATLGAMAIAASQPFVGARNWARSRGST